MLKKTGLIFTLLSVYIISAFAWWTYAHYLNSEKIYHQNINIKELQCYEATFDVQNARDDNYFEDTIDAKDYFYKKYPELELVFLDSIFPLNNFMIRPAKSTYVALEKSYQRKITMYITEGIVMLLLLFWGLKRIYTTFKNTLELKRQQSNFLLSITHELKTPIASLKLYIDTLQKRNLSTEQINTVLNNSTDDINRLEKLAENLLLSARLDSKKYELHKEKTNLSVLITNTILKFNKPREFGGDITLQIEPDVLIDVDKNAIEMLMYNLLNNAEKYADGNFNVKITLKKDTDNIELLIADSGCGIAEDDKKLIFNKFYRSGDEHTRKTKGTGLGLFIVYNIVKLHGGEINITDNKPKGVIFTIKLPVNYAT